MGVIALNRHARRKARLKANGLCLYCGKRRAIEGIARCAECKIARISLDAKRKAKRIAEGACSACGKESAVSGKEYGLACLKMHADKWRRTKYGVSAEWFDSICAEQGNACAICHKSFGEESIERPRIDHDHETDALRGLLCMKCNTLLGMCDDSMEILFSALGYLSRYKKVAEVS